MDEKRDFKKEIEQLQAEQREAGLAFERTEAARILAWLIQNLGASPESIPVATLDRLLMESPCDISISSWDKNHWERGRLPRDNEIRVSIMIPNGDRGATGYGHGCGKTVAKAFCGAIITLQNFVETGLS